MFSFLLGAGYYSLLPSSTEHICVAICQRKAVKVYNKLSREVVSERHVTVASELKKGLTKVASYQASQEISVSFTQLPVLYTSKCFTCSR